MSHTLRVPVLALAATVLLASACSRGDAAARGASTTAVAAAGDLPKLLFFMNPNGAPCRMQDGILREMEGELWGKVTVVYYRTTQDDDFAKFREFGIRALPTLVVTDAAGRELRRGSPGIQSAEQIRRLIAP